MATQTEFRTVGKPIQRLDNPAKLTGQARFAEDVRLPGGALEACLLRSPHAFARIKRIDTRAAEAMPGVHAILTAADMPDKRVGKHLQDERALAKDLVRFVGDRIAAVAAETLEQARAAARKIEVEYEVLTPAMDLDTALGKDGPRLHPDLMSYKVLASAVPEGGNVCSRNELARGDAEGAFAQCARVFEQVYTTDMVHHAYLEPHGCLAQHNPDGSFTVWSSTQGTFQLRGLVADALDVPHNRVRVVPTEIGGGFGGKISMQDEAAAAGLARKAGCAVRIVMSREEDFLCGTPRAGFRIAMKTGVSADGMLLARTIAILLDSGAYAHSGVLMSSNLPQFAEGPYRIPNLRITSRAVYTNKPPSAAFRAPGGPQTNFAIESEMDRIAEAMGWDAIEFRRKNLMPEGHVSMAGVPMRGVMARETLEATLKATGYRAPQGKPAPKGKGPWRGRGLAVGNWNVGGNPSGAIVKLNDDGSASLLTGVVDLTGVHTALAQIVAEALALPVERVTVTMLDTESAPHATISAGSQALKSMGDAALRASVHARDQLFEQAVTALDAPPARMELAEGKVRVKGEPGRAVPVSKLIGQAMAARGPIVGQGNTGNYPRVPGFGAHMAEVEVDPETGQMRLLRYVASQDVGIAINPPAVDGQIQGGVVQGIGMALGEGMIFREGRLANAGFLDYKIPSALDVPRIETIVIESPGPDGPFGAKGIGEPPIVPVPAAIANAVYAATGVRITSLPITPEKLRQALRKRERGAA